MMRRFGIQAFCAALVLSGAGYAQADSVTHFGPFAVQDGSYGNIVETSVTDPVPMYGTPVTGAGNALLFEMDSFSASALGPQVDVTSGALEMTFTSDPGMLVSTVSLFETGTIDIVNMGQVIASGALTVRYFDTQTQQIETLSDEIDMLVEGLYSFPITGPGSGEWVGAALIDLMALGIQTEEVIIALDNNLMARACSCGSATIEKDSLTVNVTTESSNIPEPASLALFAAGVAMIARRRS